VQIGNSELSRWKNRLNSIHLSATDVALIHLGHVSIIERLWPKSFAVLITRSSGGDISLCQNQK